ncbi:phage/plasmid primase, P4 family [Gracilimonas mengyeensis]|uniref:Putative DNA primase/helicase n=1 Tax=Gracilimonas mengyeensis TaxID=1302730 RepID=A0A521CG82_9BACT|nr:phage/plasmid primase, P4 family [Gracilimonas mengyeensis]SMO57760.1 putative DNA primase/helicase [Gracilimonas mengyeensis]
MSSTLNTALDLVDKGFHIIPLHTPQENDGCSCGRSCGSQGKHPRISDWPNNATNNPNQVREWWRSWPEANIGIVCGELSNLVVLDVDPRHGGEKSLDELEERLGNFTQTTTIITGGGGNHFYYRYPGQGKIKNSNGKLGDGLDIKTDGGYIVAPGCLHQSGQTYDWLIGLDEIKAFPEKLIQALNKPATKQKKEDKKHSLSSTDPIPEGERNNTLFELGVLLRKKGANRIQIESELLDINAKRCSPPLDSSEVQVIAGSASRDPNSSTGSMTSLNANEIEYGLWDTEFGNANEFVERYADVVCFDTDSECWLVWDGTRWKRDPKELIVTSYAKKMIEELYDEACDIEDEDLAKEKKRHAKKSAKGTSLNAFLNLAKTDKRVKVSGKDLDQYPLKLTLENLTYDLKNGRKLTHNPDLYITKKLAFNFDSNANGLRWREFVLQIMNGDQEMANFLKQAVGYSMTGLTTEQCLFFLFGKGKNGKSTFVEVIMEMLGEYACKGENEMIMDRNGYAGIPNDVARLKGQRFVLLSEVQEGKKLDEAQVKNLTGGDTISARFLRQEFFDFTPTHTLWLFGNHKPLITGTDDGIWRRLRLIKFGRTFSEKERDGELKEKLKKDLSGVFNWALEGFEEWKENGRKLMVPESVGRETLKYRGEMDILSSFLQEACEEGVTHSCSNKEFRHTYEMWCSDNGLVPFSNNKLNPRLEERGFVKYHSNGRVHWRGFRPKAHDHVDDVEGVEHVQA